MLSQSRIWAPQYQVASANDANDQFTIGSCGCRRICIVPWYRPFSSPGVFVSSLWSRVAFSHLYSRTLKCDIIVSSITIDVSVNYLIIELVTLELERNVSISKNSYDVRCNFVRLLSAWWRILWDGKVFCLFSVRFLLLTTAASVTFILPSRYYSQI